MTLSNYTSGAPTPDTLKATLVNINAGVIAAKYKWHALTVYGGYEYARLSSPSDLFGATATANGQTLTLNGGYPAVVQANAYVNPKNLQVAWVAGKYAILPNLDFDAAYYYAEQNTYTNAATKYNTGGSATKAGVGCGPNLNPAITGSAPQGSNAAACSGDEYAVSAALDWRILKRVDLYTGVMYSLVSGGLGGQIRWRRGRRLRVGAPRRPRRLRPELHHPPAQHRMAATRRPSGRAGPTPGPPHRPTGRS